MQRTSRARYEDIWRRRASFLQHLGDIDALKLYWEDVEDAMLKFLQRTGLGFADLPFNRNAKINVKTMSYDTSDPDKANVKVVILCQR